MGSYAELSQSGTGAHVLIKGRIPGERRRKGNIEMYSKERFFVVTGQHIEGTPHEIKENQEAINKLYKKHFDEVAIVTTSDEAVLKRCRTNKKFLKLWVGDCSDYEDDDSRADLALCGILAKHTKDKVQIDRLFRRSGLCREKWKREDYRENTINKALEGITEVYKAKKPLKISVPFDVVGDHVLECEHVFTMRDNGEIYLYKDGVYRSDGVEAILGTKIRNLYKQYYANDWMYYNPGIPLAHVPVAMMKYVSEVLAYIRAYSHVTREEIDAEQDRYINFKNGLFDLQTWKLIGHTSKIRSIAQVPVTYDPNAICPVILKYFKDCELPEKSQKVLIEFAGYSLTTFVWIQKALMLYGNGANGKSVFINLLKTILGEDFVSGESLQKLEEDRYRVANLYGKRLNAFPDLKDTPLQTNEVFNTLTGNDLMLIAERKYQNSFSFKPTAKLLFSANKIPFAYSDNYAYYRRWMLIEFPKTFEKDEIDEKILEKMTTEEEKSGFVNLMLEGLKRVIENRKYSYDLGVAEIERQYLLHSDNVPVFEEEELRDSFDLEQPTPKGLVYEEYVNWCEKEKLNHVKPKAFTRRMDKLGRKVFNTTMWDRTEKERYTVSYYGNAVVRSYQDSQGSEK